MVIIAEWTLYGEYKSEWFYSWDEFHAATFNPDCQIQKVQVFK